MAERRTRARSAEERELRRETMLDAAEGLVVADGFAGVSMNGIALRAGLAKGTLYLYFATREEVFLALHARHRERWMSNFLELFGAGERLIPLVLALARRHPVFMMLSARLGPVIEQNLPLAAVYAEKRAAGADIANVIDAFSARYRVDREVATGIALSVLTALQGAAAASSWHPPADADLPDDVAQVFAMSRFENLFATTMELVLKGAGVSE